MPLDRTSSTSPVFSARGFEDEVLLVAMALLLDAYMQWFHIGSYRLAARFSQRGRLVHPTGKHLLVAMFRISNPWSCAGEPPWVMEEVFVENSRGLL
jgi:hypothetical protein